MHKNHKLIIAILFFIAMAFIILVLILIPSGLAYSHEQWFLTTQEMAKLDAAPKPLLFSELNMTYAAIFLFSLICVGMWVKLGRTGARELFPDHQIKLTSYGNIAAAILRFTTAVMLLMAVFGLNPRSNIVLFTSPTLIFPDLQLSLLSSEWLWIKWCELLIAIGLIFGIYVRLMGFFIVLIAFLGLYLFNIGMVYYLGYVLGIGLYLIFQGAGIWYLNLPIMVGTRKIYNWLNNQPLGRSQIFLQVMVGLDLAFTGYVYKFLHPNFAIGLLTIKHMPTFGLNIETIVLWMAIIETWSGILLTAGILVRPVAFILLGCFAFMSYALDEPFLSHTIFYGVLIACYLNGAGQWNCGPAKDRPANIVILGASLAGITAALELERLIGKITHVKITLVTPDHYVQFDPLLSEVISGFVQPGHIINPLRRICQNTKIIHGNVTSIDPNTKELVIDISSEENLMLHYDELIISNARIQEQLTIPGSHFVLPTVNIQDALCIKQRVLECLEKAELTKNQKIRQSLLTFIIYGGGLRGTSVAIGIQTLIQSALLSYPTINFDEIKIIIIDKHTEILSSFKKKFGSIVHQHLTQRNIQIKNKMQILKISPDSIILSNQEKLSCNTVISAISKNFPIKSLIMHVESITTNNHLQIDKIQTIFVTGMAICLEKKLPFQALYERKLGKLAAYNAWANSQGISLRSLKKLNPMFCIASLGKNASTVKMGKLFIIGPVANIFSRVICTLTFPGLEKNLRIIIDLILNFPFRQDISGLINQTTVYSNSHNEEVIYLLLTESIAFFKMSNGKIKKIIAFPPQKLLLKTMLEMNNQLTRIDPLSKNVIILTSNLFLSLFTRIHNEYKFTRIKNGNVFRIH